MLNFFECLFLFLMFADSIPNPQPQGSNPVLAVPHVIAPAINPITVPAVSHTKKLFLDWEEKLSWDLPIPVYDAGIFSNTIRKGFINKNLPSLKKTISRTEFQCSSWEYHLKRIAYLLSSLNSICRFPYRSHLFRRRVDKINPDCPLSLVDLKFLARVSFNYDFEVPFFSLKCSANKKDCPDHPCFFVGSKSCCSLDFFLLSDLKKRLNIIKRDFLIPGSSQKQVIFFYCETPCCLVVHRVTALVIVKNSGDIFTVRYFDPSDHDIFEELFHFVQEIFNTSLIFQPSLQYFFGMADNLSGIFSLINVKDFLNYRPINYLDHELSNESFLMLKSRLKNFLVWDAVKILRQKLIFNLKIFSRFFSQEREKSLVSYLEKNGSPTRSDFLIFKDLIECEQDKFQTLFTLLIQPDYHPKTSTGAIGFCFSLIDNIRQKIGEDFLPFDSNSLETFFCLAADLKSKFFWLNNVAGGDISTLSSPSWLSSYCLVPNSADISTLSFNLKKIRNVSSKQKKNSLNLYSVWEQDFPLIVGFLDSDPWINFSQEGNLLPKPDYFIDFSLCVATIMTNWTKPYFLFNKSFSPHRMLSAGEGTVIAKLICGFSTDQVFIHVLNGDVSDCFIGVACPRSGDSGEGTFCGVLHSRSPLVSFKKTNCLLTGSNGCFNSIEIMQSAFVEEITKRFIAYRNAIDINSCEVVKPLVIIGYCYSACCQASHQSWTLVVSNLTRQAFYFDPSGKRQLAVFLANLIQQYFPEMTLNSFENNGPQQPHGSLDFSGVLSICGAKVIVKTLIDGYSYHDDFLRHLFFVDLPTNGNEEYFCSNDYSVQYYFKNRLVAIALKRLFSHFLSDASICIKRFDSINRKFPQHFAGDIEKFEWLSNFIRQAKPFYDQIFNNDDFQTIIQNTKKHIFEDLLNLAVAFLRSRPS